MTPVMASFFACVGCRRASPAWAHRICKTCRSNAPGPNCSAPMILRDFETTQNRHIGWEFPNGFPPNKDTPKVPGRHNMFTGWLYWTEIWEGVGTTLECGRELHHQIITTRILYNSFFYKITTSSMPWNRKLIPSNSKKKSTRSLTWNLKINPLEKEVPFGKYHSQVLR